MHGVLNTRGEIKLLLAAALFCSLLFNASLQKIIFAAEAGGAPRASSISLQPEKITFPSPGNDKHGSKPILLDGYVFRPVGKGPFPAIVALHGCSGLFGKSGRLSARFEDWGRRLTALGYVVLFPDSFHSRGISEVCTRKDRKGFSAHKERAGDALGALAWLQAQSSVRGDRIGLMGWSNGGTALLAAIDSSLQKEPDKDFRVAIAFYPGCAGFYKKGNWLPRIPLTILIGEADDWTPASFCRTLTTRAQQEGRTADLVIFPHAYHAFDHPNLSLRTRNGLAFTVRKEGTAHVGTNPEARAAAIKLVPRILDRYLQEK